MTRILRGIAVMWGNKVSDDSSSSESAPMSDKMPCDSLDKEAKALLEEKPLDPEAGRTKIRGLVTRVSRPYGIGRKPKTKETTRNKPTLLKRTVKEAEDYGAYVPVLTNGFLSA